MISGRYCLSAIRHTALSQLNVSVSSPQRWMCWKCTLSSLWTSQKVGFTSWSLMWRAAWQREEPMCSPLDTRIPQGLETLMSISWGIHYWCCHTRVCSVCDSLIKIIMFGMLGVKSILKTLKTNYSNHCNFQQYFIPVLLLPNTNFIKVVLFL